jgi:hypothetical protein
MLGTQPGDGLIAPLLAVFNQATEGVSVGQAHRWAGRLAQGFQPPAPLRGDLLERRSPHRGMRVADQGHRGRRGGIPRRALSLSDLEFTAQAAVSVYGLKFGSCAMPI